MRILVLTNLYPPHYIGGYELMCQTVVDALRERGHMVAVVTSNHRVESARHHTDDPAVERSFKINGLYGHPWHGIWSLQSLEEHNHRVLQAALRKQRPDLVYVWNMGGLSKGLLFALQRISIPSVFFVSDHWIARALRNDVWLNWWRRKPSRIMQRVLRAWWTLSRARARWEHLIPEAAPEFLRFERIYFCSRALRDLTVAAGFNVAHGAVIYCPVHARYFRQKPAGPRAEASRLLFVGRIAEDKGVITALRALELLRLRVDARLTVCGQGDPDYTARLRSFAQDRNLPVDFIQAPLEEMPEVYRRHDVLLFTSEWVEPFALTPIEAMASGLVVVGTITGGSAELFRHRENALTYTAGDACELAERIEEFVSDFSLRSRCSETAWHEVRNRYSTPVIVDQIEAYLEESFETYRRESGSPEAKRPLPLTDSVCAS